MRELLCVMGRFAGNLAPMILLPNTAWLPRDSGAGCRRAVGGKLRVPSRPRLAGRA